jgi:hypothetical protein
MWKYVAVIAGIIIGLIALLLPDGKDSKLDELWMFEDDLEESEE